MNRMRRTLITIETDRARTSILVILVINRPDKEDNPIAYEEEKKLNQSQQKCKNARPAHELS